jgi:hypothetical protein
VARKEVRGPGEAAGLPFPMQVHMRRHSTGYASTVHDEGKRKSLPVRKVRSSYLVTINHKAKESYHVAQLAGGPKGDSKARNWPT